MKAAVLQHVGGGDRDGAGSSGEVGLVQELDLVQMLAERRDEVRGKERDSVPPALGVAHADLPAVQVQVLDAERAALAQPEAGAVHERRHESVGTA